MKKDYADWHELKRQLNKKSRKDQYFYEREIWYCSIGLNIGHEQNGKNALFERPVLIIRKFSDKTFWGIPLTSKEKWSKKNSVWKFTKNKKSTALLSQLKLLNQRRLQRKIGIMPKNILKKILIKLFEILIYEEIRSPINLNSTGFPFGFPHASESQEEIITPVNKSKTSIPTKPIPIKKNLTPSS